MVIYLVVLLNFLVHGLLLMCANRLTGRQPMWKRCTFAALLGGAYAGLCMLPECRFLGSRFWHMVILAVMMWIAYGWDMSALRRGGIFLLLNMALWGMAVGFGNGNILSILLSAIGVVCLCTIGVHTPLGMQKYQPVELLWHGQRIKLTALLDTGNTLWDPLTGESVLVVGIDVGQKIGISQEVIEDPVTALCQKSIQGARLIPYRSIGQPGGMLLMMRMEEVRLNGEVISPMVAFAPEEIGRNQGYQALAGGAL